jgi:hypothetical protein
MQCPIITSASPGPRYTRCDDSESKDLEVQGLRGGLYRNNKIFSSDTNLITMKHYFYYQPIGKAMVSLPQRNARTSRGYRTWPSWPIAKVIPFPSILHFQQKRHESHGYQPIWVWQHLQTPLKPNMAESLDMSSVVGVNLHSRIVLSTALASCAPAM